MTWFSQTVLHNQREDLWGTLNTELFYFYPFKSTRFPSLNRWCHQRKGNSLNYGNCRQCRGDVFKLNAVGVK